MQWIWIHELQWGNGQLSSVSLYCAAVKYACTSALRIGGCAEDIVSPAHHVGNTAYANLYFAFSNGKTYHSHGRMRLIVLNFTEPLQCSCRSHHEAVQEVVSEADI